MLNLLAILLLAVWFYGVLANVESGWPWLSLLGAVVIWLGLLVRRV